MVNAVPYRHPAVLANMASTLDIVSGGRLELGIGAGGQEEEAGSYGIDLGTNRERCDRLEEACQVLVGLFTRETTDFDGSGEKRTLRIVARYAQHWNFVTGSPEDFARKRAVLASHCADVGRDPADIRTSAQFRMNRPTAEILETVAAFGERGLDLAIIYLQPPYDPAVLGPLADAIRGSGLADRA